MRAQASAEVGHPEVGEVVEALETRPTAGGGLRVRSPRGWVSGTTSVGVPLLQPAAADAARGLTKQQLRDKRWALMDQRQGGPGSQLAPQPILDDTVYDDDDDEDTVQLNVSGVAERR